MPSTTDKQFLLCFLHPYTGFYILQEHMIWGQHFKPVRHCLIVNAVMKQFHLTDSIGVNIVIRLKIDVHFMVAIVSYVVANRSADLEVGESVGIVRSMLYAEALWQRLEPSTLLSRDTLQCQSQGKHSQGQDTESSDMKSQKATGNVTIIHEFTFSPMFALVFPRYVHFKSKFVKLKMRKPLWLLEYQSKSAVSSMGISYRVTLSSSKIFCCSEDGPETTVISVAPGSCARNGC